MQQKVARARNLIKAIPVIRKAVNDYLDDLVFTSAYYIATHSKGESK